MRRPLGRVLVTAAEEGRLGPEWGSRPGVFADRGRHSKGDGGHICGGFGARHSLPGHTSKVIRVKHLGRGEGSGCEDDRHEGVDLRGAGSHQMERGWHRTVHGVGLAGGVDCRLRSLVAMDMRGVRDGMKPFSLTDSACRCAAADRWTCCRAWSRSK